MRVRLLVLLLVILVAAGSAFAARAATPTPAPVPETPLPMMRNQPVQCQVGGTWVRFVLRTGPNAGGWIWVTDVVSPFVPEDITSMSVQVAHLEMCTYSK